MKNLFLVILLFACIVTFGQSGYKNFLDQNYIEVTGTAKLEIIPNLIFIKVILNEKDSKNKTSLNDTETILIKKLKELGIDQTKEISISDFSSNFRYKLLSKINIVLSKEYLILVHDGNMAGKVFQELEKIDISNVSIDHVDHTKIEDFRKELKVKAIQAGKEKANLLVSSIDQTIGRALYIQEIDGQYNSLNGNGNYRLGQANYYDDKSSYSNNIDFEKIGLEYSILIRFELK